MKVYISRPPLYSNLSLSLSNSLCSSNLCVREDSVGCLRRRVYLTNERKRSAILFLSFFFLFMFAVRQNFPAIPLLVIRPRRIVDNSDLRGTKGNFSILRDSRRRVLLNASKYKTRTRLEHRELRSVCRNRFFNVY